MKTSTTIRNPAASILFRQGWSWHTIIWLIRFKGHSDTSHDTDTWYMGTSVYTGYRYSVPLEHFTSWLRCYDFCRFYF